MPEPSFPFLSRTRFLLEYSFVRFFVALLQFFPLPFSRALGKILGKSLYLLTPRRTQIARENLVASLPKISEQEIKRVVRSCWENLGSGLAEFSQMNLSPTKNFLERFECEGLEYVRQSYREGKGVLILTAHFGVWETGTRFWPDSGFKTAVVARRVKNPYVNALVTNLRSANGTHVILARDAVRESLRWLKEGGLLAILMDHRVTAGGMQVPFFGRPAYTTSLPALLALRYKIPVHPVYCFREGGKFKLHSSPALNFSDLDPDESGIYQATLRMHAVLENWIRERPDLWLWIHNRWKT